MNTARSAGLHWFAALIAVAVGTSSRAEDWGAYAIIPADAPGMALGAADSVATNGTPVSLGRATAAPNQKWFIIPAGDNFFSIKPAAGSKLVLSAADGGAGDGTPMVLETEGDRPWQRWSFTKQNDGSYMLTPQHAAGMRLDDFGGNPTPAARIDLWENRPGDPHLKWLIKPMAGSPVPPVADSTAAAGYEPPPINPADVRPGAIQEFTFTQSAVFPGTVRTVTVFIPAQYDGSKPACVYVKTDGYRPAEKTLLETAIATREIPVTVGVFVNPGTLPALMKGTLDRRNRGFEYDGLGDNNVRFLTEELLPFVAKKFNLNLSTNGNDRCLVGGSSGGITAFNAAWERPEAFSRVYAASGSFVAFRGGNEFPTLVRKFEAKPIRAFLTTGTHDMENCAGDWFLLDQEMDKALKFSGYDYQFRIINGGHVAGYAENWREAMAYLWKGWPERVLAGTSAPRARDILVPGEAWQLVTNGCPNASGPTVNASGEVFFADAPASKIYRLGLDGHLGVYAANAGQPNGLTVGADGTLYSVSRRTGKVMAYDSSGQGRVVVQDLAGDYVLAHPNGGLYVTSNNGQSGSVWFVKDGGKQLVDSGLKYATGLAYRPDQWLLSVADGRSKWAWSYQINPDGTLANKERLFCLYVPDADDDAGAASVCYAQEGQMFVATRAGVQVCADDGPTQVILPMPDHQPVAGICLGGRDLDTLFAFSGDKIWQRKLKVHALGAFTPWLKVRGTGL